MTAKANHIVFTTIYYPELLRAYKANIERAGLLHDTKVWVIGDRKTPGEVRTLCESVTDSGMECLFIDIAQQNSWGKQHKDFYERLPYDNETRRNIGYLMAYMDGCQRLISIDDDNWPTEDDFLRAHGATGSQGTFPTISSDTGYYNICQHLSMEPQRAVFPRGYPFRLRANLDRETASVSEKFARIGLTAGLWLREPDIDATTWVNGRVEAKAFHGSAVSVLNRGTWTPINTQNTSVVRELMPAYFCVPMGWKVPGGSIQRYGDIWGGYFFQALIENTDWQVAFGQPLVDHRRNPHNYLDDLRHEFWGMILTDWLLEKLRSDYRLNATGLLDRIRELGVILIDRAPRDLPTWCAPEMADFFRWTGQNLIAWGKVFEQGGNR